MGREILSLFSQLILIMSFGLSCYDATHSHLESPKYYQECTAIPIEKIITGTTHSTIRYVWYDCNNNSKEDGEGDTYIADYNNDGNTDRKVIFRGEETIIDYFSPESGNSRIWMWFIYNDKWHLTDFEYSQVKDQWESEHRNGFFALFKKSSLNSHWYPYSESPFCFFDTDNNGIPEIALRFASMYNPKNDANNYDTIWEKLEEIPTPLLCSIRISFNLNNNPVIKHPYSYTLSFSIELLDPLNETPYLETYVTREGRKLYYFPKDIAINLVYRILSGDLPMRKRVGLAYEFEPDSYSRWEGIIWYNDGVHNIANAGGPWFSTNRLQEFIDCTNDKINLYYSNSDKLIHLVRSNYAIRIKPDGNIYYKDKDCDGYAEIMETSRNTNKIDKNQFSNMTIESLFQKTGMGKIIVLKQHP